MASDAEAHPCGISLSSEVKLLKLRCPATGNVSPFNFAAMSQLTAINIPDCGSEYRDSNSREDSYQGKKNIMYDVNEMPNFPRDDDGSPSKTDEKKGLIFIMGMVMGVALIAYVACSKE